MLQVLNDQLNTIFKAEDTKAAPRDDKRTRIIWGISKKLRHEMIKNTRLDQNRSLLQQHKLLSG